MDLLTLGAENRIAQLKDTVLKKGDKGDQVLSLQKMLKAAGYDVGTPDGDYGNKTYLAVVAFQKANGLVQDGKAGPKTMDLLDNQPSSHKYLTHDDLVWAADALKCEVASIRAVNDVESKGSGFLADGRPVILYERHVMARVLKDHGIDEKPYLTSQPGLVNKTPGGYAGGSKEYDRLAKAKQICEDAALESASWGAYQIMGYHWALLGYASVQDFVKDMQTSERKQLEAFVKFIQSQAVLLKAIRAKDWPTFARYYNGADYKKNQYDTKLADAYKEYA